MYNYQEIRKGLLNAGHILASEGDTEVIAHLAEQSEPVALARQLDGMFAFAVWDTLAQPPGPRARPLGKKTPVLLDRMGTPSCSLARSRLFWFTRSSLQDGHGSLSRLPHLRLCTKSTNFFEEIRSVPPAHVLMFELGADPTLHTYWEPPLRLPGGSAPAYTSLDDQAQAVRNVLSSAVQRRLVADVPAWGLSERRRRFVQRRRAHGRLDERPVSTFTIGFEALPGISTSAPTPARWQSASVRTTPSSWSARTPRPDRALGMAP